MNFIFDPSLVLYLPLHELAGSSFKSRDACGHLGTVTGALWRPNGRSFDGMDDYIACGGSTDLQHAKISAEAWVYLDTGITGHEVFFGNTAANLQTGWGCYYYISSLNFYVQVYNNPNAYYSIPLDNAWHHFVGTYDGSTLRSYVDGAEGVSKFYATGINYTGTNGTVIGSPVRGSSSYGWTSKVGEVRLYSRVLSPLEIQRSYLNTKWRYQ